MKFKFELKELLYTITGVVIILVWFLWLKDLIAPFLLSIPLFLAMIIYEFGLWIGLFFMSSILNSTKFRLKIATIIFLVQMGVDIISAPYMISHAGIIDMHSEMWYVATDTGWGSLWSYIIPMGWLWTFTYIITPILLMLVIPGIIANPKSIKKAFS